MQTLSLASRMVLLFTHWRCSEQLHVVGPNPPRNTEAYTAPWSPGGMGSDTGQVVTTVRGHKVTWISFHLQPQGTAMGREP